MKVNAEQGFERIVNTYREEKKSYISSSHLGLIRCLNPLRVSAAMHTQTIWDKLGNPIHTCRMLLCMDGADGETGLRTAPHLKFFDVLPTA